MTDANVTVPSVGSTVFDGNIPVIYASNGYVTVPSVGSTVFGGNVPDVSTSTIRVSNVGDSVFDGNVPNVMGTVNPGNVGDVVFGGYVPNTYSSPPFFFKNEAGLKSFNIDFESLYAGIKSKVHVITAVNNTPAEIEVGLSLKEAENQLGSPIDTYNGSCFLSVNNVDWSSTSVSFTVPAFGEKDFYIFYQPSNHAKIGLKQWELSQDNENLVGVEVLSDYYWCKCFNIIGGSSNQSNADVIVMVDIDVNKMQAKAEEIRFCLADGTLLDFTELSVLEYVHGFYKVTIPYFPASPSVTSIYAYVGDFTATSIADAPTTRINWDDGTLDPFVVEGAITDVRYGEWKGVSVGQRLMYMETWWNNVYVPSSWMLSSQVKGYWEVNFRALNMDGAYFYFYFMYNDSSNYCVRLFQNFDDVNELPCTLALVKNDSTILASATVNFHYSDATQLIVTRDKNGLMKVYWNGVKVIEFTDNSITTSTKVRFKATKYGWYGGTAAAFLVHDVLFEEGSDNGGISDTEWLFYTILQCRGEILYSSRDLPGISREIRYGCKIGDKYYE